MTATSGHHATRRPRSRIGALSIGTSGWAYDSWRGLLYPAEMAKKNWLIFYSAHFASTEINGSFYRTPALQAVRAWRDQTPEQFTFAWKASKFITHWKRLTRNCENSIALMETRLKMLDPKIAVVLFQLPPRFTKNCERLSTFLDMLPKRRRYAFEFRHESWYDADALEILRRHDVALCISDHADAPAPWRATARHVYIRGHGPEGNYTGRYSVRTLRRWAKSVMSWRTEGRNVFVYFDNDQKAAAPADAQRLIEIVKGGG